ncbi:hypothetical protein ACOMHN_039669 [Nucella lapillus]
MAGGIFAFYGRASTSSFRIAQAFSREFNMPFISLSHSGAVSKPDRAYFVSIVPHVSGAIADLIGRYRWPRLNYLYDSNEGRETFGLYRVQYIHTLLTNLSQNVEMRYFRLEDIHHAHEDLRRLDRHTPWAEKNFILDLSSVEAYRTVLAQ